MRPASGPGGGRVFGEAPILMLRHARGSTRTRRALKMALRAAARPSIDEVSVGTLEQRWRAQPRSGPYFDKPSDSRKLSGRCIGSDELGLVALWLGFYYACVLSSAYKTTDTVVNICFAGTTIFGTTRADQRRGNLGPPPAASSRHAFLLGVPRDFSLALALHALGT